MFLNILKGILIGGANVIPGISGGTIAFILGIYEFLTEAIGNFFVCTWHERKKYFKFLLEIGVGVLIGIIIFSKIIMFFYGNYQNQTQFFFVGLIIISLKIILEENQEKIENNSRASFLIGFILILMVSYIGNLHNSEINQVVLNQKYYFKLYLSGLIAGSSMVVPGLSGSLILIILGEYENILNLINNKEILAILFVLIGSLSGILLITKFIDFLFKKYKNFVIFFVIGMISASIFAIIPNYKSIFQFTNIVSVILGISLVLFFKKYKR